MKRCTKCNREFDDSKAFCPECGNPLITVTAAETGGTAGAPGSNGSPNTSGSSTVSTDSPWYAQWAGTILAVVGLIIEWELSALLGAILIVIGFFIGKKSSASGNKIVTTVLLVIGIILLVITMFL